MEVADTRVEIADEEEVSSKEEVTKDDQETSSVKNLPNILIHQASECEPDAEINEHLAIKHEDSDTGEANNEHPVKDNTESAREFLNVGEEAKNEIKEHTDNNEVVWNETKPEENEDKTDLPVHAKYEEAVNDSSSETASEIVENILQNVAKTLSGEQETARKEEMSKSYETQEQNETNKDSSGVTKLSADITKLSEDLIETTTSKGGHTEAVKLTREIIIEKPQISVVDDSTIKPNEAEPRQPPGDEAGAPTTENRSQPTQVNVDNEGDKPAETIAKEMSNKSMEKPSTSGDKDDAEKSNEFEVENQLLKAQILDLKDDINRLQESKSSNETEVKDLKLKLKRMIKDGEENSKTISNLRENLRNMEGKVNAQSKLLDSEREQHIGSNGAGIPREKVTVTPQENKKSSMCNIL